MVRLNEGMLVEVNGRNIDTSDKLVNGQEGLFKGCAQDEHGRARLLWVHFLDPCVGRKKRIFRQHVNQHYRVPSYWTFI